MCIFSVFFFTTLFMYNWHTINCPSLKCTIWWVLTCVYTHETITTSKVMYLALILRFSSCPFVIHPLASPSPDKHWQTAMLLSVPLGHLFYCWVVFHCIDILQFIIHSHVDRTTVCFQSVTITNTAAVNIWV